jgi:RecA-family ATPase
MSNVAVQQQAWAWQGVVPLGCISIWYGDGDVGKSTTLFEFAARLSRGECMPGEKEPHLPYSSIIFTTEDSPSETIAPRLRVADADCGKVHIVTGVESSNGEQPFHAVDNLELLQEMIDSLGDCKMIAFDPIAEYLGGINAWKDDDLRPALAPLKRLAEKNNVALICIAHLNKKTDGNAKQRMNGAQTLLNVARAAWLFTEHPDDDQIGLMLKAKGNVLKRNHNGFAFSMENVRLTDSTEGGIPRVSWIDERPNISANQALDRQQVRSKRSESNKALKVDEAVCWLRSMLTGGAKSPKEVGVLSEQNGIKEPTLYRAKKQLGVVKNELGQWELAKKASVA